MKDVVVIASSEFGRPADDPPAIVPPSADFFHDLHSLDDAALLEVGMRPWNSADEPDDTLRALDVEMFGAGGVLWLFPGEWHRHIPAGLPVVTINGARRSFSPTDSADTGSGCLAYGIVKVQGNA